MLCVGFTVAVTVIGSAILLDGIRKAQYLHHAVEATREREEGVFNYDFGPS